MANIQDTKVPIASKDNPNSFSQLPHELAECIIRHLLSSPNINLPVLAGISEQWQYLIEKHTFASLNLSSSRIEDAVKSGILTSHRAAFVSQISFAAELDGYDPSARDRLETSEEKHCNSSVFTR